jgi:hypothetical protein
MQNIIHQGQLAYNMYKNADAGSLQTGQTYELASHVEMHE